MIFSKEILEELNSKTETEFAKLDLNTIRSNLKLHSPQKLCEMIVSDRYLGFGGEISVMCMEELASRRENGEIFDFESHIEEISKELPDLSQVGSDFGPDLRAIIQQVMKEK